MPMDMDYLREAQKIWKSLQPIIDKEIERQTRSMVRAKKMTVISPPDGSTIGVAEPFGQTLNIPYSSALSTVTAGDAVWVYSYFSNASTMIAMATGEGQILPEYASVVSAHRNLLAASDMVQCELTSIGDLTDSSASATNNDYTGLCATAGYVPVTGGSAITLTLYDTRLENIDGVCRVAQYNSTGAFLSLAMDKINWKEPQSQTVTLRPDAAFVKASVMGYPKYRWKLEQSVMTTDWQPSPLDIL